MIDHRNCRMNVVLGIACGIIEGDTYSQLKSSVITGGNPVTEDEGIMASCYVIKLHARSGASHEEVAEFCARSGLPVTRGEAMGLAQSLA